MCQKSRRQGARKQEEKAGFISWEIREQIITPSDCIDDYIADNNSARVMEAYVDSLDVAAVGRGRPEPNAAGGPMYDPKDVLKWCLYGYMIRVRPSGGWRRKAGGIWKRSGRRAGPPGSQDHSGVPAVERRGIKKELMAVDGSEFKAADSKDRSYSEERLRERMGRLEVKIRECLAELEAADREEAGVEREKRAE